MGPLIDNCTNRLIEQFEKKSEEEISINIYMKRFTMDTIWNCAFGLDIDLQNNPENPYLVESNQIFRDLSKLSFFRILLCKRNFISCLELIINTNWTFFCQVFFQELEPFIYPLYRLVSHLTLKFSGSEYDSVNWLRNRIGQLVDLRLEKKVQALQSFLFF